MNPTIHQEVRLFSSNAERERYDNMADFFAIIVAMEHLEKAYVRDSVTADEYTAACVKLLAQYKTASNLLFEGNSLEVEKFMREYGLSCPAATKRFKIGVPATTEHASRVENSSNGPNAKYVAVAVQLFITLMDSLRLKMVAKDQVHPLLADLLDAVNKVAPLLPPSYDTTSQDKLKQWLITLNTMRAHEDLSEDQVRDLLFDLESAHSAFHRALDK